MLPRLFPVRPRLLLTASVTLFVMLGLSGGTRVSYAQNDPDPGSYGSYDPNAGAADASPDVNSSAYISSLRINDPDVQPQYRQGNCCVPWVDEDTPSSYIEEYVDDNGDYVPPRFQCFWNIGNDLSKPADQIAACKNFQYTEGPDEPNPGATWTLQGRHYDLTNHVLCNIRCGDLMNAVYCDPNGYQCLENKEDLPDENQDGEPDYENLRPYVDKASCESACRPPADVITSVGCSCNLEAHKNTCTVYAWQDLKTGVATTVYLKNLEVSLDWWDKDFPIGTLAGPDGEWPITGVVESEDRYADPNNPDDPYETYQSYNVDCSDGDYNNDGKHDEECDPDSNTTVIEFAQQGIPIEIPPDHWFAAEVAVEAIDDEQANPTSGEISALAVVQGVDPNNNNNYDSDDVNSLKDCRKLTVNPECFEEEAGSPDEGKTFLHHLYTLDLRDYANDENVDKLSVDFTIDSCLAAEKDWVEFVTPGCDLGQDDDGYPNISCSFPVGYSQDIPEEVSFWIAAQNDDFVDQTSATKRVCKVGEPIEVTAEIWTDPNAAQPDETLTVSEAKTSCKECDVCHLAVDRYGDPSKTECEKMSESCRWDENVYNKNTNTEGPGCVRREDVCDVFYGCCKWVAGEEEIDEDGLPYTPYEASYLYAGRKDGKFVSDIENADDSGNKDAFDEAAACVEPDPVQCNDDSDCDEENYEECGDDGYCFDTNIISVQQDTEDFSDEKYEYWKSICELESTTDPRDEYKPRPEATEDHGYDYFCSNFFDENEYANSKDEVFGYDYLNPQNLENLEIYDEKNPDHDLKEGSIFFSDSYSPVAHEDSDEFVTWIDEYNAEYTALGYTIELDPDEEYYDKLDGPRICEESKTLVTCCAPDGCLVLSDTACGSGMQEPVGPETMAGCLFDQELDPNPCAPPLGYVSPFPVQNAPSAVSPGNNPPLAPGLGNGTGFPGAPPQNN